MYSREDNSIFSLRPGMDHTEQGVPLNFGSFQGLSVQLMFEKAKGRELKETKKRFLYLDTSIY